MRRLTRLWIRLEASPEPAWAIQRDRAGRDCPKRPNGWARLMVHYSTDYVYDGSKQGPWVETDKPNPLSVYGKTKLAGDEAIAAIGRRLPDPAHQLGVRRAAAPTFLLTMLRLAKERPELRIVDEPDGQPTTSECLAQATADILSQVITPGGGLAGRGGVYHLTSSGATTWFGFAKAFFEQAGGVSKADADSGQRISFAGPAAGEFGAVVRSDCGDVRNQDAVVGAGA